MRPGTRGVAGRAATRFVPWPIALALAAGTGCTFTHRVDVPRPVVDAPPASRRAAAIGVHYTPADREPEERLEFGAFGEFTHRWTGSADAATRQAFDALLPRLFARVEPAAAPGPPPADSALDAVLDVHVEEFAWERGPPAAMRCRAQVVLLFELHGKEEGLVARWRTGGGRTQEFGWGTTDSSCIGEATAMAIQDAAGRFARELPATPGAAAWLLRFPEEPAPPAEEARAAEARVPAVGGGSAPGSEPEPVPEAARPVSERRPFPPRAFSFFAGGGVAIPRGSPGHLPDARNGGAISFGFAIRPWRHLAFELEGGGAATDRSAELLPDPGGGFISPVPSSRLVLDQRWGLLGARAVLPFGPFEASAAAGFGLVHSELSWPATLLGFPGTIDQKTSLDPALHAGLGLDLYFPGDFFFGGRWRWIAVSGDFGQLSQGSTGVRSAQLQFVLGWAFPQAPRPARRAADVPRPGEE